MSDDSQTKKKGEPDNIAIARITMRQAVMVALITTMGAVVTGYIASGGCKKDQVKDEKISSINESPGSNTSGTSNTGANSNTGTSSSNTTSSGETGKYPVSESQNNYITGNLQFCLNIAENGIAQDPNTYFSISPQGGYIKFLTSTSGLIGVNKVTYEIYSTDSGNEVLFDSFAQDVQPDWSVFWYSYTFYNPGIYRVYVFRENPVSLSMELITSNDVTISLN